MSSNINEKQQQENKIENEPPIKKEQQDQLIQSSEQTQDASFFTLYLIIFVVAFSQGILTLSDLALSYLYKDDFQMNPAEVSVASGIVSIPWVLKPFYGIITDTVPYFGYRRKSYIIQFGFIAFLCWNLLAFEVTNKYHGIFIILLIQFCVAFNNVIGEALIVEVSQKKAKLYNMTEEEASKEASKNVSLFFGVRSAGVLITAYLGGVLLEIMDKHTIFWITSFFPLTLCLVAFFLNEQKVKNQENRQTNNSNNGGSVADLIIFLKQPQIYKPIIFIFLYTITPTSSSAMFFFYTNELGFRPEFLGQLKLAYAIGSIIAIISYNLFLQGVEFKKQFICTAIISAIVGYSQILLVTRKNLEYGIPDKLFCLGDSIIIQIIGELNMLPVLILACKMCPKNIEGTMYATIMSTLNFGSVLSSQLGALVLYSLGITSTNFDNLWIAILITNTSTIIPLLCINLVNIQSIHSIQTEGIPQIAVEQPNNQPINNANQNQIDAEETDCLIQKEEEQVVTRRNSQQNKQIQ